MMAEISRSEFLELKADVREVCRIANDNRANIAKLAAERSLANMLIRWIIFPLITILAAGYSVSTALTRLGIF